MKLWEAMKGMATTTMGVAEGGAYRQNTMERLSNTLRTYRFRARGGGGYSGPGDGADGDDVYHPTWDDADGHASPDDEFEDPGYSGGGPCGYR